MTAVVLASASPSRRRILAGTGITPHVIVSDVDEAAVEAAHPDADVRTLAGVLAEAKGRTVLDRILTGTAAIPGDSGTAVLIASDSILELGGRPVGKPHTAEATRRVWEEMGGSTAHLHTGHCVARLDRNAPAGSPAPDAAPTASGHAQAGWGLTGITVETASTVIRTVRPSPAELDAYIATGEPLEVAGALTIDGFGGAFVTRIEGDHHNVIGLSLPVLRRLVTGLGVFWPSLWDARD